MGEASDPDPFPPPPPPDGGGDGGPAFARDTTHRKIASTSLLIVFMWFILRF